MLRRRFIASVRKPLAALYLLGGSVCLSAQPVWLTIVGSADEAKNDVVQVDPASRSGNAGFPTLSVRVSRATLRSSWDDVPYRSYVSTVVIDCDEKTGRYTEINFYMMPLWQGKPHKSTTFAPSETRAMRFRDIEPNPTARIVRAACTVTGR